MGRVRVGGLRLPRGRSGAGLGGGSRGIGGVLAIALIVGAVWVFTGGDLGSILSDGPTDTQADGRITDDPGQFIAAVLAETDDYVAMASEYQALTSLPNIDQARIWEPEPATIYSWQRDSH